MLADNERAYVVTPMLHHDNVAFLYERLDLSFKRLSGELRAQPAAHLILFFCEGDDAVVERMEVGSELSMLLGQLQASISKTVRDDGIYLSRR